MKRRRTVVLSAIAAGLLTATLGIAPAATSAPATTGGSGTAAKATSNRSTSDIALKGYGYGTRVVGGEVPAGSSMTAFTALGCAVKTGLDRTNEIAEADLQGNGTVSGVKTELWTRNIDGARHSYSRNAIASLVLADSPFGSLSIRGITSLSHAWHDAKGFHAETESSVGKIVFTPPAGDPQVLDLPTPGQPVPVPGLGTIYLGGSGKKVTDTGAAARATALRVDLTPSTGSEVYVARTTAQALSGVKHGRFGGFSAGTEVTALDSTLHSGRNPLTLMPCQGTNGEVQFKDNATVDLGGQVILNGVSSRQRGTRFPGRSVAWERGSVAELNLGGGQLVVDAVVGKATAIRKSTGKLITSTDGSTVGSITANGEPQTFPDTGVLEIPGVARLEPMVVTEVAGGISVVALRITLLDGTGAVIDLGVAKATIRAN
ncbi:choice-of-anchor P family protein [Nocardioides sp.]|uniref:choice-of-anchor P family protein n=1 Tax=Nocardioides sp. TaxID=35761 RepID=UPI00262F0265|nr:choice-of-anchor P family protein [Nocardioides sp.]MDI6908736.1 choice-of-anchor P family protein [Nocardioides sp.]